MGMSQSNALGMNGLIIDRDLLVLSARNFQI